MHFNRKNLVVWTIILLLAFLLRIYGLDLNPVGLSHDDELHEIINAKSIALTGSNVPGVVAGILTQNGHCIFGDCIYGELESYILIPWMRIFPFDMFLTKIPFVLASLGLVWATGKLFENLSRNTFIGMLASLLVAINPWAIYYGRTAYAITFVCLFYILAAYFFTRHKSYKQNLIFGGLSSFCASLFYFGAKPILPFIISWGIIYNLYQFHFRFLKFTLLFILIALTLIGGYFLILNNSFAGKRLAEVGKGITVSERVEKYLGFFSPTSLFLTGQRATDNYFISNHGYYYLIDFPFLILGIIAMLASRRKILSLFVLMAIAVIPAALKTSETSIYSHRSALAYPLISGVIGWGYYFAINKISFIEHKYVLAKKISISKVFLTILSTSYLLSITYFLTLYWHRLPTDQSTRWFFHERVLSNYITRTQANKNILVISNRPDGIFNSYVFYSGIYNNYSASKEVNNNYLLSNFEYKKAKFISNCDKVTEQDLKHSVIFIDKINDANCKIDQKNTPKIANPKDAGGIFNIVNESLCVSYPKNRYPAPKSIYDFKVENLTNQSFCKMWITNPDIY